MALIWDYRLPAAILLAETNFPPQVFAVAALESPKWATRHGFKKIQNNQPPHRAGVTAVVK